MSGSPYMSKENRRTFNHCFQFKYPTMIAKKTRCVFTSRKGSPFGLQSRELEGAVRTLLVTSAALNQFCEDELLFEGEEKGFEL